MYELTDIERVLARLFLILFVCRTSSYLEKKKYVNPDIITFDISGTYFVSWCVLGSVCCRNHLDELLCTGLCLLQETPG